MARSDKSVLRFLLTHPVGIALTLSVLTLLTYLLFPVLLHGIVWEGFVLLLPFWFPMVAGIAAAIFGFLRYANRHRLNAITLSILATLIVAGIGISILATGFQKVQIQKMHPFAEVSEPHKVSNDHVRFKPMEIAQQALIRTNKSSKTTPTNVNAIGTPSGGVAYIAPLTPQGVFNHFLVNNDTFVYLDDAGTSDDRKRIEQIPSDPFQYGEQMWMFNSLRRRLIFKVGFTNTYPEIYYAPVYKDGEIDEVVAVVPYISWVFRGVFVPTWGGVAIVHANGSVEDLSPKKAMKDLRLKQTGRAYPETLMQQIVESQRFDEGLISGWIKRDGKIEVPELPGDNQQPYFLSMADGTYRYVTAVEPDGAGYSVMRIYTTNALTGEREVFRYDTPEFEDRNPAGPAKSLDFAKSIKGYNWLESDHGAEGGSSSGTFQLVEPRPVTPAGTDQLHWMLTITDKQFSKEHATVFVNAETGQVSRAFETRGQAFAFLRSPSTGASQGSASNSTLLGTLSGRSGSPQTVSHMCEEIATIYLDYCGGQLPR